MRRMRKVTKRREKSKRDEKNKKERATLVLWRTKAKNKFVG
jgi:hypothetical protein